ncbi:tRNA guanosine(34) transglycosylase Tgt, partial [Burkholderia multivorans]
PLACAARYDGAHPFFPPPLRRRLFPTCAGLFSGGQEHRTMTEGSSHDTRAHAPEAAPARPANGLEFELLTTDGHA